MFRAKKDNTKLEEFIPFLGGENSIRDSATIHLNQAKAQFICHITSFR